MSQLASYNRLRMWWPQFSLGVLMMSIAYTEQLSHATHCRSAETQIGNTRKPTLLQVMAIVPIFDDANLNPDWVRGEEILPVAHLAADEINARPDLLNGYQLEIVPVRVPQCEISKGIVPFVDKLTSNHNIIGIAGYYCHNVALYLSELAHLVKWTTNVIQISATTTNTDDGDLSAPYLQHSVLPQKESIAAAAVELLKSLRWNRIAVLSKEDSNFLDSQRTFYKAAKEQGIEIVSLLATFNSPIEFLHELQRSGIRITVAFVPKYEAVDILCTAYRNGFKWPDYAWIFTDVSQPETLKDYCPDDAINNAIFLHLISTKANQEGHPLSGQNQSAYHDANLEQLEKFSIELNTSFQGNVYANVLYDSIWAIGLTINRSVSVLNERNLSLGNVCNQSIRNETMLVLHEQLSQLSFQGTTGWLNFSHSVALLQTVVEILHLQRGKSTRIGFHLYPHNEFVLNNSELGVIPIATDTPDIVYVTYSVELTTILSIIILCCFILTTVFMCLFIYYRNEPAIRATSNILSLCVFVGCYLLLSSSMIHNITSGIVVYERSRSLRTFICVFDLSASNVGIDIIVATVIAKTLRIYYIFKTFGKVSQLCSDHGLFTLISGIVSVKIVMLIALASLDAPTLMDREQFVTVNVPPYFEVAQQCLSERLHLATTFMFAYSILLVLVMVLLAILTRKIQRGDYKDSKKINALVLTLLLDAFICLPLWYMFRSANEIVPSRLAYNVSTIVAALFCQLLLIMPKIIPVVVKNSRRLNSLKILNRIMPTTT